MSESLKPLTIEQKRRLISAALASVGYVVYGQIVPREGLPPAVMRVVLPATVAVELRPSRTSA